MDIFGVPSGLNVQLMQYHDHVINFSLPPEVYSKCSQVSTADLKLWNAVSKELFLQSLAYCCLSSTKSMITFSA